MTSPTGGSETVRASAGFTLVETLLAVMMFAIGVTAVMRGYSASVTALDAAADTLRADALLRERMAAWDLRALEQGGSGYGNAEGRFEGENVGYCWRMARRSAVSVGLTECTLSVWRPGSPRTHSIATWMRSGR